MKIPSLESLFKSTAETLKRFPFVLLTSVIGTALWLWYSEIDYRAYDSYKWLLKLTILAFLGISLQFSIAVFTERKRWNNLGKAVGALCGFAVLAGLYFAFDFHEIDYQRFALYALAFHLLTSFASFLKSDEINGFWQFNKEIFLRILTSGLYSGVLYAGLAIAIAAIENLFNIEFINGIYLKLFIVIAGVFNTWFFLSGVPENLGELENSHDYPKALKVFTQYVLLPLVTVYLVILYAYVLKIIIEQLWPQGWVATLVLAFSIAGILSLLLIWPIRNSEGNSWISTFSKWFYRALLPLSVLLGLAIWRRVSEYGITEERYFVIALAVWLLGITLYFIVSKKQNIKVIPISLFLISLAISFGPWGAFEVSKRSQITRLENILVKNGVLKNGKVDISAKEIPGKQAQEVRSIIEYLSHTHGWETVYTWLENRVAADVLKNEIPVLKEYPTWNENSWKEDNKRSKAIAKLLKSENFEDNSHKYRSSFAYDMIRGTEPPTFLMTGFDYLCKFSSATHQQSKQQTFWLNGEKLNIHQETPKPEVFITFKGEVLKIDLRKMATILKENETFSQNDLYAFKNIAEAENKIFKARMIVTSISGHERNKDFEIFRMEGDILIDIK
ncbi:MAG: DUF4153 domain-containing protein [Bacteroidota bacterium]